MKRLLLYTDMASVYGAEQITHALALGFVRSGWQVTVAQPRASHRLVDEEARAGVAHRWLAPDLLWDAARPARMLTDHEEPAQVMDETRPDLVVFSDGAPMSNLTAKEVAAARGFPYVVLCHCVTPAWAGLFARAVARLPAAFARARAVVAVSQENLDLLRRHFGLAEQSGMVVHNGRPDAFFAPRSSSVRRRVRDELGLPAGAVVAITVGRLDLVKGYQYQVAAFKHLRDSPAWRSLRFVWVGDGTLAGQLRGMTERLRMDDRVRFLARRDDVPDLLDAADLFVLPSLFEGMPLAILEAMAKRLPVIATAVSGTPEALADTGCLLPPPRGDAAFPQALAAAIARLAQDAAERERLGTAAYLRADSCFRESRMVERYLRLADEAIGVTA